MDEFEIAYYLDGPQLLLLLSLIDGRPVMGLPPIREPEDWQDVSLSLLQDGRLRCQGKQLVMDQGVSELLLAVKDAARVDTVYGNVPEPVSLTLFGGKAEVLLEHLPNGTFRIGQVDENALFRLVKDRLFPLYPMPDALLAALPEDESMQECLRRWEGLEVSMDMPAAHWGQVKGVRGVLERWTSEGRARWVWVEDDLAGLVLRQDRLGIRAELDTPSRRRALARELEWEESSCCW